MVTSPGSKSKAPSVDGALILELFPGQAASFDDGIYSAQRELSPSMIWDYYLSTIVQVPPLLMTATLRNSVEPAAP